MKYTLFPSFIFRSPLLPFNHFKDFFYDKETILNKYTLSDIQEAIQVSSPVLYSELQKLLKEEIVNRKDVERILASLVRYLSRMSTRCTPFGLFAGCSLGKIESSTNIIIDKSIEKSTRLDMYYLSSLYNALIKNPQIKEKIKFYPNTSLYKVGKKYRYVETLYINSRRKYQIAEVEQSPYLNKILKVAKYGENTKSLATTLVCDEITSEDALGFIDELIESQLLVAELNQSVTGNNLFHCTIQLLEKLNIRDTALLGKLNRIKKLLGELDSENSTLDLYEQIVSIVKELGVPYEEKYLLQVDMTRKAFPAFLGTEIVEELMSAMTFLNKITPTGRNEHLNKFRQDFYNRYENREISLMEALDSEMGIGYPSNNSPVPSPLIDDLIFPQQMPQDGRGYSQFQSILFGRATQCSPQDNKEILFTDEDFKDFKANWNDLPPTISTMFEIIRANPNDTLLRMKSCGGICAANLLGRFAHTDPTIEQLVKNIANKEQELMPDVILAEIAHLPEARVGNILFRPHIRDYEIPYMSNSNLPQEQLLLLSDLMLSVKQNRLVIRSKRLNKEIVPRLTTAHNYYNGTMPVYRFLCDMQMQSGRSSLYFNWGQQLEKELSYFPRVRYKNTILSPATWLAKIAEITHLFSIQEDDKLLDAVDEWRNKRCLPRYVLMPDGDNELFIDWKAPLIIRSLFSLIKKRFAVKFTEFLFDPKSAVVKDDKGDVYTNECILAFHKK